MIKLNTINHFERTRNVYRDEVAPILEFSPRHRVDQLISLAAGKKVLDLGCVDHEIGNTNSEHFLHGRLAQAAKSIKGLDYELSEIQSLLDLGFNVEQGDVENFDLRGEKFDIVIAGEIIEHLTNPRGMLDSARKHLNEGGKMVISTSNGIGLFYFASTLLFGHEIDSWDHTCLYTPITMTRLLKKCGYRTERVVLYQPIAPYPHNKAWMHLAAKMGNMAYRVATVMRKNFARSFMVIAEPIPDGAESHSPAPSEKPSQ